MTNALSQQKWLIDLDGVVWLADEPIPGAREAIAALRIAGCRVAFFTNNSFSTRKEMLAKFERHGIATSDDDLLSSSQAAAAQLAPGSRATVLGGAGIDEALVQRGVTVCDLDEITDSDRVDAVVIGLDRRLTFDRLTKACRAITRGAAFIATNDDATYPTADGVWPGGGALIAAVAYATRVAPRVAGKPHAPAADLVRSVLGSVDLVVGDRPETDGDLARRLGARFAIVRSGVTPKGAAVEPLPDEDANDLADLVARLLGVTRQQMLDEQGLHS